MAVVSFSPHYLSGLSWCEPFPLLQDADHLIEPFPSLPFPSPMFRSEPAALHSSLGTFRDMVFMQMARRTCDGDDDGDDDGDATGERRVFLWLVMLLYTESCFPSLVSVYC